MSPQYVYSTLITPQPGRSQDIVDKIIEYKTESKRTRGFCTVSVASKRPLIVNNAPFDQDMEALQAYIEELLTDPYSVRAWAEIAAMSVIAGMDPNPLTGSHDAPYLERTVFSAKSGERDALTEKLLRIRDLAGEPFPSVSRPATGDTNALMMMRMVTDFGAIGEFRAQQEDNAEARAAYVDAERLCESVEREYARLVRLVRRADE